MSNSKMDTSTSEKNLPRSKSSWPPALLSLLLGGLVGALLGWYSMKAIYPTYVVPEEVAILPDPPPIAAIEELEAYQFVVDNKNYALVYAVVGAWLGACASLFTLGLTRIFAALSTAVLAAMGGGAGAIICNIVVTHTRSIGGNDVHWLGLTLDSLAQAIIAQGALWGLIGLGVGLGLGIGARGLLTGMKAGFCGFLGGALGATLFLFISAYCLPNSSSNHVMPKSAMEQIAIFLIVSQFICGIIALSTGEAKKDSPQA